MPLILPNSFANGTNADAAPVQENFDFLESYINGGVVLADGSVAMTAPLLLLAGDPTGANHAANKDYVDAKAAALNTGKVAKAGDTMTGLLIAAGNVQLPSQGATSPPAANHAIRKDYADSVYINKSGDTMTGNLTMGDHQIGSNLDPVSASHQARKGYVDAQVGTRVATAGDTMTGALQIGGNPDASGPTAGVRMAPSGGVVVVASPFATISTPNMIIGRGGSPGGATNAQFVRFDRGSAVIGSITIDSATSTAFNTTSDERTKHRDGAITDAAARVQDLGRLAFRGQILDDNGQPDGTVRDLLYAHDVAVEAPYVVNGERGAVDGDGQPVYQTVNFTGLIPLLFAALADALDRIDALEAR